MKNLIAFIRSIRFLLFFIFLQVLAFIFISNGKGFQTSSIISSSNTLSGWMYEKNQTVVDYFHLAEQNKLLLEENTRLQSEIIENYRRGGAEDIIYNDTIFELKYKYFPAKVIKNSVNKRFNILTLNVGRRQGIEREMGVINSQGVVGFVKDVSQNYCTVMPLMNENVRLTAKSKKQNIYGNLVWESDDNFNQVTIKKVPTYINLVKGDTMVSTSQESIFPEGKPIGRVLNISKESGSNYKIIQLKTTVDFYNLSHVMVIKNMFKEEIDSLNIQ